MNGWGTASAKRRAWLEELRSRWAALGSWVGAFQEAAEEWEQASAEEKEQARARLPVPPTPENAARLVRILKPTMDHYKEAALEREPDVTEIQALHAELQSAEAEAQAFGYGAPPKNAPPSLAEVAPGAVSAEEGFTAATSAAGNVIADVGRDVGRAAADAAIDIGGMLRGLWDAMPLVAKFGVGATAGLLVFGQIGSARRALGR